ncbi:MAG TPA: YiiX/YebB-like N1pC/P60 family cysteine hydrolase [Methylotenera sp.]|nr:YiiX/YebB-like N1pC/P60 family cysteine hydrolase [Methylotenera sp.]HPH04628.1 YiiX/YebB-like N1pC/P60 family cysteine hydrolase [Methylotenera sp.]HPN01599.1 YiiX/YebB-like N1pC/P60 family cysteine hydrolase [Methylotenera sp.]
MINTQNKQLNFSVYFLGFALLMPLMVQSNTETAQKNDAIQTLEDTQVASAIFESDAQAVLSYISSSQKLSAQLPSFLNESTQAIKKHQGALPSAYALRLAKALSEAHDLRDGLFKQALTHRSALYRVDDSISDNQRVTEIVIAMSAAVTLFENSKTMHQNFDKNPLLKRKLNEGYPEFGIPEGFYDSSTMRSNNPEYRKAFTDAVRYFADNREAIEVEINRSSTSIQSLYQHIAKSPMLKGFKGANVFKSIAILPFKAANGVVDVSGRSLNHAKFTSSKIVGNTMGAVRWRDGKLKDDAEVFQTMQLQLQPGDILLEKTPFTLTDKSIPGHFGHAAVYVGTKDQLKEMNLLEKPIVQKNIAKIEEGHGVVEALRSGVQLNKLQDFMNVDDVAVLRPKYLTLDDRRQAVTLALSNIGKKYDFNFDVNTTDTIVCSELIYIVYPQVDFVTKNVLGSFSITPDDIAQRAGATEQDPLEVVLFAHNGKLVCEQQSPNKHEGIVLYERLVKPAEKNKASNASVIQRAAFSGFL